MKKQKKNSLILTALLIFVGNITIGSAYSADDPNALNRLFTPPTERDSRLEQDGIHDPEVSGLKLLQQPSDAFKPLTTSKSGNYVDWVKSREKGQIKPLHDYTDPNAKPITMELSIVMEIKGSMPDVTFPHLIHTVLLDCVNCHNEIFKPQKGANPMSMAEIMLGEKCGVCHGTVAFPVTECRRCHNKAKPQKVTHKK